MWGGKFVRSDFVVAAKNVDDLVLDQFLQIVAGRLQISTGIEISGMLIEVLADGAGHGKTQVGVNVDLADSHGSSLTELLLGNTNCIGHCAAVLVDHLNVLLRYGGRTVENDGETRQTLGDFLENVEPQRRRNQNALFVPGALLGSELECAVKVL